MYEIVDINSDESILAIAKQSLKEKKLCFNFDYLKCSNCLNKMEMTNCNEIYFDYKNLFNFNKSNQVLSVISSSNNRIELYSELNLVQSQEINFNYSIFDALEECGFLGSISFQAVIQRFFKLRIQSSLIRLT